MFDSLENRRLLAANLTEGVLSIDTGKGDDKIAVEVSDTELTVTANGKEQTFDLADVDSVEINSGQGNDLIVVADTLDVDVKVEAGQGNDTVVTGAGDDDIEGGPGNDDITAGAGDDDVEGGPGDDDITGGEGDDDLSGGPGNNTTDDDDDDDDTGTDDDDDGGTDDGDGGGRPTELNAGLLNSLTKQQEHAPQVFAKRVIKLADAGYEIPDVLKKK